MPASACGVTRCAEAPEQATGILSVAEGEAAKVEGAAKTRAGAGQNRPSREKQSLIEGVFAEARKRWPLYRRQSTGAILESLSRSAEATRRWFWVPKTANGWGRFRRAEGQVVFSAKGPA